MPGQLSSGAEDIKDDEDYDGKGECHGDSYGVVGLSVVGWFIISRLPSICMPA